MSIECVGVNVSYGRGAAATHPLKDVSLKIPAGQAVALTGPSGSGKSTFLRVLAGIQRPQSGTVSIAGQVLTAANAIELRRGSIGMVFQDYRLVPFLTARDNVMLRCEISRRPLPSRGDVDSLLQSLGLLHLADRVVSELSGGEQQRVGIARALVVRPAVLLADEPTGALDRENSQDVAQLLSEAARLHEVAVLVATHDPEVSRVMDSEITLRPGARSMAVAP